MAKEKESGPKDPPKEPPKETGKEPPKENPPPVQVVQSLTYCPWGDGYAGGPDQIRGHILGAHVKGEQPGTPTPVGVEAAQATPTQPSRPQVESTGFDWEGDEGFRWGEDTPNVRLQEVLQWMMVPAPLATYIGKYHARNKQIQNWLGLYNFLSGYKGFDVDKASHVATHVYGGQEQRPTIMGGPAVASRSRPMGPPGEESQDSMDQTLDHTMRRLVRAIEVRNMAAVMGPALAASGTPAPTVTMVPKIGPDGKILLTPEGNPMYEYVSAQPQAAPLATMIRQYERGEAVDPTKLMEAVVNAFTKGVEVTATAAGRGRGGDTEQMLVLQEKLESARQDAIKAQFDGIQRGWEQERQFFRQTIDQMSPDKFAEQVEKWKKLGFMGTDNVDALKLQLRWNFAQRQLEQQEGERRMQMEYAQMEKVRQDATTDRILQLGQAAVDTVLKPISVGVGKSIESRGLPAAAQYGGPTGAPPGAAPPTPQLSVDQQLAELDKLTTLAAQEKERLLRMKSQQPPGSPG